MPPFEGKTYSLYSDSHSTTETTDEYFNTIKRLADLCLQKYAGNEKNLLAQLQKESKKKKLIGKLLAKSEDNAFFNRIKKTLKTSLSIYTKEVKNHLKHMSIFERFDSTLRTTEEQYHLYMLEIELVNRIYKHAFKSCTYKFALLPHCLRDFRLTCLSAPGDIEHTCKGCTKECYIHLAGKLLKKYNIDPYISVRMDQDKLLKEVKAKHQSVGVLGIACIPELARGMRLSIRLGIPPIGIPLDANRCARWMGKAYENSINLKALEELISQESSRK
ncbi:MAG: DUF116 domain-containing protein [Candidatus Aminicenantes bacterium]|nr:DUF116 domain-containing protein [Candidatus Aminicenantes bacterium]NIM82612.1 DUF116 domain-containing protein [Candidatus Aminicenantes bacterium]NIN21980.1 DUF116 domain-containing protein [Candidatus Aminicenantes bacterium]NIN45742.1 DUF116 domain-containing protein [Candidatus Aminicenantes bacterium]NIN88580.1 DUF116 domain-containing protein [Candidatus Aminicenantes bacterium]